MGSGTTMGSGSGSTMGSGGATSATGSEARAAAGRRSRKSQRVKKPARFGSLVGSAATDDGTDPATWLELGPDGTPVPTRPGVVTVEVRADVDLGEGFAGAADPTGVMRLLVDGTPRVVAYRVLGGQLDVIPGPGRFDSLDAFITWARSQYASGEGMR